MNQTGPWSVKGIDQRARDAAREAASAEGLTLGEYLNRLLMTDEESQLNEISSLFRNPRPRPDATTNTLDRLTRRIEAAEARSTLAISGMDHTVLGLVAKLEHAEQNSNSVVGHVESLMDEIRDTYEALQSKVRRLEQDESNKQNLEALKSLEQALGKLADHVNDEGELAQHEAQAIKGRVEAGFADLTDRVEGVETRVESKLSDAAARVNQAVEQAEKRSEKAARELTTRLSTLESEVQERFATAGQTDERLTAVESDVSGALDSMESTLLRIQERLNRAETTTDAALQSLEATFNHLDNRVEALAGSVDPELAEKLRSEFEARFDDLTKSLRETVDQTRLELADEIARTANVAESEVVSDLTAGLSDVQKRLAATEERQSRTMATVSSQVSRISTSFDQRIRDVEARDDTAAGEAVRGEIERLGETVSARIDTLADQIDHRVSDSETRSAQAIEQIGEQVASAASRLQKRQDDAIKSMATQMEEDRKRTDVRLSDALSNVSERLEHMQAQSSASLSPVQRAIASLATRLESLEEFTSPPYADPDGADAMPEAPDFAADPVVSQEAHTPVQDDSAPFEPGLPEIEDDNDNDDDMFDETSAAGVQDDDAVFAETLIDPDDDDAFFEAGIAGWDAAIESRSDPYKSDFEDVLNMPLEAGIAEHGDEDFSDTPAELGPESFFDPLSELEGIDGEHDSHTEARASDIFDMDDSEDEDFLALISPKSDPDAELDPLAEDHPEPIAIRADDTNDYIARARRAAISAAGTPDVQPQHRNRRKNDKPSFNGVRATSGSSKLPLYAAASAVVITGAAVGGYLYIRGKQEAPVVAASVDTYVDPGAAAGVQAPPPAAEPDAGASQINAEAPVVAPAAPQVDAELFDAAPVTAAAPAPVAAAPVASNFPAISPFVTVESAAAAGNHIAQYQLAQERIAAGDFATGAALMRKSAAKGLPIAQYGLAKLHEKGNGVPKDLALAREWTEKAANGGNVRAMHDLAVFMAEGDGGPQSYAGAVEWFRKAAEFGIVDSQYNLGVLYEQGLGISPNLTEAMFWFEIAGKNGDAGAPAKIADLSGRISAEAAEQARARAVFWEASRDNAISNGRFGAQPWNTGNPLQVQGVQVALSALGYNVGTPDGVIGGSTAKAIRDYEKANGLPVTGTITADLIESLNALAGAPTNG
ncbi:peptidoglycan-binding protein [Hyphomonas sp.]|uniref:peptidoglycan-binding protein n=1 Tax=Hyphomonas sp. TaxID=87 RepID=UPI0030F9E0A6